MALDSIQFEQEEESEFESEDSISQQEQAGIFTRIADPEVDSLHRKWKRGKLIIRPDFQRRSVWDSKTSSRLIESALLDIPLPVIYLSEEKSGNELVIDGQQRLTSFFNYIDGKMELTGLKVFHESNKQRFDELSEEMQDKIMTCQIRTITFLKQSSSNLKFEIFERLNTGSVSLNAQELRNCVYRGEYNDFIKSLSQNERFMKLFGLKQPDTRMKDVEFVLRFFAFHEATYLRYKASMRSFLNSHMQKQTRVFSEEDKLELSSNFKNAVDCVGAVFGEHAFKKYSAGDQENGAKNGWSQQFNASLYDIFMFSFARKDKNLIYGNADAIREAAIHLMTADQRFINSIEKSTSSEQAVRTRFEIWERALREITDEKQKQPRCFSRQLKQQLYDQEPTCQICGQHINDIDNAAVDHIEQYWLGGKTIPENARLAHRYCNNARPRRE